MLIEFINIHTINNIITYIQRINKLMARSILNQE